MRSMRAPQRSSSRITAGVNSTASLRRFERCPKSSKPPAAAPSIARRRDSQGSDIAKALCLGARAVLAGRAYAYGLGAAGGPGVARALMLLRADLQRTLRLLGCPDVAGLGADHVEIPGNWR